MQTQRGTRTVVHSAAASLGWVVLATRDDPPASALQVPTQLTRNGFSVLELVIGKRCPISQAMSALRHAEATTRRDNPNCPVLLGGVRDSAPLAARLAAEVDSAGLLSIDGSMLSIVWKMPGSQTTTLLLASSGAGMVARLGLHTSGAALGRQVRVVTAPDPSAVDRALRGWQRAAEAGAWPDRPSQAVARLAVPTAAVLGLGAGAALLGATPVAAAQRSGDGVAAPAAQALAKTNSLGGVKVGAGQRGGDGVERSHATGSQGLVDGGGFKWFVNTDITFSTSSSASAAMSEGSFTHAVTASTLNGGTVQDQLNDAYDGYNSLFVSVNGTFCTVLGQGCVSYNKNGPAAAPSCSGQDVDFPVQAIDGLNVSRRVFVPKNDHFERTLNVFNNPGATPITATMSTSNNLGSDNNTVITGTSNGTDTPSNSDEWVTTFQNWTGTTTTDPRLGHVLQTTGAAVGAKNVTFSNGSDRPTWGYTFTVDPGQTVIVGNFAVADGTIAASKSDSARLAALPANALQCMSATDESELGNFATAPTVTTQPVSQGAKSGASVSFSAQATAVGLDETPAVQWQVSSNGGASFTNLPGATSSSLSLQGITAAQNGDQYRAVFTNGIGSATSNAATLTVSNSGYWLADAAGGVQAYGVPYDGSLPGLGLKPAAPIVGLAATPDGGGYWLVGADGGVFGFGDAKFHGSAAGLHLAKPIVGMAPTSDGGGYWLVGADGGVFAFGDAKYEGSAGGVHLAKPITGIASTPDNGGYWLVGADGGVFSYGDAKFHGSAAGLSLVKPIAGIAATPDGGGYWLVGGDGGVFTYGDAVFSGSMGGKPLDQPVDGMAATSDSGYWLVGADGGVFAFGGAAFKGSGTATPSAPVVGLAG